MIYIVEDDENIREMESYALKNSGFEVIGFGEGKSFFAAIEKRIPLLVVLDIMLPGDDGLEILKKIKAGIPTAIVVGIPALYTNYSAWSLYFPVRIDAITPPSIRRSVPVINPACSPRRNAPASAISSDVPVRSAADASIIF